MHTFLCFVLIFAAPLAISAQEASPCPRIFTYEPKGREPDKWYGIITLLHDVNLTGVWLRIIFDRPIIQLGNWFGTVVKKSPTDYLIKNPAFNMKAHEPKIVRIYVRYNVRDEPPKLVGFRLNGRVVCPEELATTTPSTTTEQLFTSADEEESESVVTKPDFTVATTTKKPFISMTGFAAEQPLHIGADYNVNEICGTTAVEHRKDRHIGQVAHRGEFPWHAMLYYTKDITIAYLCGAALISKLHLVTVAHCVVKSQSMVPINPERLVVYLGKYFVKNWSHDGSQTRYVTDITPHPHYHAETYDNDIAVLKLLEPCDFTQFVRPVCLWKDAMAPTEGRPGTVIGWGFDKSGKIEDKLMYVQMVMQGQDVCNRSVSNYFERFKSKRTYCASFIDDSVECVGDSGGGMVYPTVAATNTSASVWQLRGLVTVSVVLQQQLTCNRNRYVVFTDVTKYHQWIKECTNLS